MARQYWVKVWTYKPYLIDREFTVAASTYEVAVRRAVKQFRAQDRFYKKQLDQLDIRARRI